jgi:hypothetical protein
MGWLTRLFFPALLAVCFGVPFVLLLSVAAVLRLLPPLLAAARQASRWLLILSFRFYFLILSALSGPCRRYLRVNPLVGLARLCATVLLSLAIGTSGLWLADLPVTVWTIGALGVHGLLVGLIWDEALEPGGLRLGVSIE